jgi:phytoene dehydrogenase-like protein
MSDAVVIGAGPNGLVAANVLADAGWDVVVLESADTPGGAVRTAELTLPGFQHDVFSAFYPLAAASPVLRALDLERHGLEWSQAPLVLAHPTRDGLCPVLSRDLAETAAALDAEHPGDGDAWQRLYRRWLELEGPLLGALMTPFPPLLDGLRLARGIGLRQLPHIARFLLLPVRRLAAEEFAGRGGGLLLGGNALHTDLSTEDLGSGAFGWLLASLGQHYGFPTPRGGAQRLIEALVRRLEARGGRLELGAHAAEIVVRRGRAVAVRGADGTDYPARRAVLGAIDVGQLYSRLVGVEQLPARVRDGLRRFELDAATFKVDWALDGPVPWTAEQAGLAGTLHLADSLDELTTHTDHVTKGLLPASPFAVVGQMSVADPTRSPPGTHTLWAYTTLPQAPRGDARGELSGQWRTGEADAFAERLEARIEALAPGFADRIIGRHILTPQRMQAWNASLIGGQRNGGTSRLYQQLVFRPTPGLGRPETPVARLYLASASAHPGGGVHGGPGANAARAALHARRARTVAAGAGAAAAVWASSRRRRGKE